MMAEILPDGLRPVDFCHVIELPYPGSVATQIGVCGSAQTGTQCRAHSFLPSNRFNASSPRDEVLPGCKSWNPIAGRARRICRDGNKFVTCTADRLVNVQGVFV
jgi:hypothetical protein